MADTEVELTMGTNKRLQAFGGAILAERLRLGLTQRDLGGTLGVDGSSIGNWERGKCRPSKSCYEDLLAWCPSLIDHPLPETPFVDKPVGWLGSHEGASPPIYPPQERAKPNRVTSQKAPPPPPPLTKSTTAPSAQLPLIDDSDNRVIDIGENESEFDLLKSTVAFVTNGNNVRTVVGYLQEARAHGMTLNDVIEVLGATRR